MSAKTRGMRNNNPLNIRRGANKWLGEVDSIRGVRDADFCQFSSLAYGYRAAIRIFFTYQSKYRCKTIREIITRWAPPIENNTRAYINRVVNDINIAQPNACITADTEIDLKFDSVVLTNLLCAMMTVENGRMAGAEDREAIKRAIGSVFH